MYIDLKKCKLDLDISVSQQHSVRLNQIEKICRQQLEYGSHAS